MGLVLSIADLERRETWERLWPGAKVDGPLTAPSPLATEALELRDGFAIVPAAAPDAALLRRRVETLHEAGIPLLFVYLDDAFWTPGLALAQLCSARFRRPFVLLDDGWAFRVEGGAAGWPAHRGIWEEVLGDDGAPSVLNTWIALSDVPESASRMWVVPFSKDPAYPANLKDVSAEAGALSLPTGPGDAAIWNANLLHWGGRADASAPVRVSHTFTIAAEGSAFARTFGVAPVTQFPFRARLDFVARQFARYASHDETIPSRVLDWARATVSLAKLSSR